MHAGRGRHGETHPLRSAWRAGLADRRAVVSIWVAMFALPFLLVMQLALDMSQLALAKAQLQRSADIAALAGAMRYQAGGSSGPAVCAAAKSMLACAAAAVADDMAEVNGIAGAQQAWSDAARTMTDNDATAAIVAGVRSSSDTAISVTLSRAVPATFALGGSSSYSISATAITELVTSTAASGPQPCIAALNGYATGVTTNADAVINNGATVRMSGCSLRSNGTVSITGGASVTASGIYAAGSISLNNGGTANGSPQYPNDGQIADPYAGNTAVQAAFAKLGGTPTAAYSGHGALSPGTYASLTISNGAVATLQPGLYVVNGGVTVGGGASVTGSGVTIVAGGAVSIGNGATFSVTAPGTSPSNGAISGVLFADNGSSAASLNGGAQLTIDGVLYFPNAAVSFSNGAAAAPANNCLEVIASSVSIVGGATLGGQCSTLGATSFGSAPASVSATLVQ